MKKLILTLSAVFLLLGSINAQIFINSNEIDNVKINYSKGDMYINNDTLYIPDTLVDIAQPILTSAEIGYYDSTVLIYNGETFKHSCDSIKNKLDKRFDIWFKEQ